MAYALVKVSTPADWADYHAIRRTELFEARGLVGVYDDKYPDDYADFAHPFLLKGDGRALGTVRLDLFGDGKAAVRLVAIVTAEQRRGHGRAMDRLVADKARALGVHTLFLNAADDARDFYRKVGWESFEWSHGDLPNTAAPCNQMRKLL